MSSSISDDDVERIRVTVFAGRKIEAIKLYRNCSGAGLMEAKDFVENLESELRRVAPERFSAPPRGKGCAGVVLCVLMLPIVLTAWLA